MTRLISYKNCGMQGTGSWPWFTCDEYGSGFVKIALIFKIQPVFREGERARIGSVLQDLFRFDFDIPKIKHITFIQPIKCMGSLNLTINQ